MFDDKNTFVYSICSAQIFGTHPQTLLCQFELTRDGRGAYQEFLDYYESHSNMEQASMIALGKLNGLSFTHHTGGGLAVFTNNFFRIYWI